FFAAESDSVTTVGQPREQVRLDRRARGVASGRRLLPSRLCFASRVHHQEPGLAPGHRLRTRFRQAPREPTRPGPLDSLTRRKPLLPGVAFTLDWRRRTELFHLVLEAAETILGHQSPGPQPLDLTLCRRLEGAIRPPAILPFGGQLLGLSHGLVAGASEFTAPHLQPLVVRD